MYTIEEYNKKIDEKYKTDKFRVFKSNTLIKGSDRIDVCCEKCGFIKNVEARSFIRIVAKTDKFAAKLECPNCREERLNNKERKRPINTLESVSNELFEKFTVLNYINNEEVTVICKKCNNKFTGALATLRKSNGCINCNGRKMWTISDLQKESDKRFGKGIFILDIFAKEYKTCTKRFVKVKYNNKEYEKSVSEFLIYGISRESKRNIEYLKEEVANISNGKYNIKDTVYTGRKGKYTFYNVNTGYSRILTFDNFINSPVLETNIFSRYALKTFQYLNFNKIYFNKEKSFYAIGKRRFDIYLPESDSIIEIDGEQHFFNNKRNHLLETVKSDLIKNTFCKDKNKTLLRISYNEFKNDNYKKILDLFFSKDFDTLIKNYNILLIHDKKIYNENTYYEPTKSSLIKLLAENLINCGKPLRA